ncbi:MAG: nucleoid occlusion factor SlmA [Pseudomonadales bacterium]|nr:nucleoid occlusion factor SlmA [Pseudomonadales bacterium]
MSPQAKRTERRQHILEALACMLENEPGNRITTAKLAREVGVSEAALYRHFPSKAKMYEGLIDYIENVLFSRINQICAEQRDTKTQCEKICTLVLIFAEKNPGLCRILTAEALTGEAGRLRQQVNQIFNRVKTQIKQLFRESEIRTGERIAISESSAADLLTAYLQGKIMAYTRSNFTELPTEHWMDCWAVIEKSLFDRRASAFQTKAEH